MTRTSSRPPRQNKAPSPLDSLMAAGAVASSASFGLGSSAWMVPTADWAVGINIMIADNAILPSDADLMPGPVFDYSANSIVAVGTLNHEWLGSELLPRILIETAAREVFGAAVHVRFYIQSGEDGLREVAEVIAEDVASADELALLEENLLERVLDLEPEVLEEITLVCHRRD